MCPRAALVTFVFLFMLAAYDVWSTRKIHRAILWAGAFLIFVYEIRLRIGKNSGLARLRPLGPIAGQLRSRSGGRVRSQWMPSVARLGRSCSPAYVRSGGAECFFFVLTFN